MNTRQEQKILMVSACGALFFALLALTWGILVNSQMIMFDGVYSFISLLLTGLYFYTAKSMEKGSDRNFPYGRSQLEPMVIVVQSIVLLLICTKALISAVLSLFTGAQDINSISGMGYAFIGVLGCFIVWKYIKHAINKNAIKSELVKTQGSQWLMDTMLSLAVLIGFLISYILQLLGFEQYARYMDPLMVIFAVLFFVREPMVSLIEGIRGMLIMAPDKRIYDISNKEIKVFAKEKGFDDIVLRLGKSGRELVYEVSFVSKDPNVLYSVTQMDKIRKEVELKLLSLFDSPLWLCVSFIHDKNLA